MFTIVLEPKTKLHILRVPHQPTHLKFLKDSPSSNIITKRNHVRTDIYSDREMQDSFKCILILVIKEVAFL